MYNFLLTIHIISVFLMIGMILLQKSESGGLVSSSGMGGLMSARGTANFFTRTTAILAGTYFATALLLAVVSGQAGQGRVTSLLDKDPLAVTTSDTPVDKASAVQDPAPAVPSGEAKPAAPAKSEVPTG